METIDTSGRGTSGRFGRLGSTPHLAPQDDQLMSEHRILRFKPALRLERRGQHGQNKPNQRDHRASLADSVARKIRIRFSVHTRASIPRGRLTIGGVRVRACAIEAPSTSGGKLPLRNVWFPQCWTGGRLELISPATKRLTSPKMGE